MDIENDVYTIIQDKTVAGENIIELSTLYPLILKENLINDLNNRGTPLDMYRYYKGPKLYIRDTGSNSTETVCPLSKVELIYHMLNSTWNLSCEGDKKDEINEIINSMEKHTFSYLIYNILTKIQPYASFITVRLFKDGPSINSISITSTANIKILMTRN